MGHSFQVRRKWNRDLRIQLINVIILGQEAGCCGIPKQWLVSWLQFMVAQGFGWRTSKILACLSFVGNFEQFFIFSLYFYRIILDYIWPVLDSSKSVSIDSRLHSHSKLLQKLFFLFFEILKYGLFPSLTDSIGFFPLWTNSIQTYSRMSQSSKYFPP